MSHSVATPSIVDSEKDVASSYFQGNKTERSFAPGLQAVDEGYDEVAQTMQGQGERSAEEQALWDSKSRQVVRKLDWFLLPLMCCLVGKFS